MDYNIFNLGLSLLILALINITLGSITSIFQQQFDKIKFLRGFIKASIIVLSFVGVIYVGSLNPDIVVISVNNQNVDLYTGTKMLMLTGYLFYGKQVLIKLSSFVSGNYKIEEIAKTENKANKSITEEK